jgi:hypothetical protein
MRLKRSAKNSLKSYSLRTAIIIRTTSNRLCGPELKWASLEPSTDARYGIEVEPYLAVQSWPEPAVRSTLRCPIGVPDAQGLDGSRRSSQNVTSSFSLVGPVSILAMSCWCVTSQRVWQAPSSPFSLWLRVLPPSL